MAKKKKKNESLLLKTRAKSFSCKTPTGCGYLRFYFYCEITSFVWAISFGEIYVISVIALPYLCVEGFYYSRKCFEWITRTIKTLK